MTTQNIYYNPSPTQPVVFAAAASAWAGTTAYVVGDLVTESGSTYFCLVAHTSGTFATDLAAAKWLVITPIVWTPQNEGTGKGRISAVWDRGAGHLPAQYRWRCSTRWAATVAAGDALRLYFATAFASATAALTDGDFTYGDAEITSESNASANCDPIGQVTAATATDQLWCSSGLVEIYSRYVALVGWNSSSTKALTNTDSDHWFLLYPIPPVIEAAA